MLEYYFLRYKKKKKKKKKYGTQRNTGLQSNMTT